MKNLLIKNKIIKEGHFKLTSGLHSDTYINKDAIYCNPILFHKVVMDIEEKILSTLSDNIYTITSPAVAGIVLGSCVAHSMAMKFIYPEKSCYDLGDEDIGCMVFRRGYDKLIEGKSIIIIEDIITTGHSVKQVVDAVKFNGGDVAACFAIWNRNGWQHPDFPTYPLIEERINSWHPNDCPLCKKEVKLTDPKKENNEKEKD